MPALRDGIREIYLGKTVKKLQKRACWDSVGFDKLRLYGVECYVEIYCFCGNDTEISRAASAEQVHRAGMSNIYKLW